MGLNRSSYYLSPATESEENLRLMRLIDQQFLRTPFYGSRRMTASLERSGETVNRKRVQRLMALMGLDAIFPKPRTTVAAPDARVYPYLLRDRVLTHVNEVWSSDITYVPMSFFSFLFSFSLFFFFFLFFFLLFFFSSLFLLFFFFFLFFFFIFFSSFSFSFFFSHSLLFFFSFFSLSSLFSFFSLSSSPLSLSSLAWLSSLSALLLSAFLSLVCPLACLSCLSFLRHLVTGISAALVGCTAVRLVGVTTMGVFWFAVACYRIKILDGYHLAVT